MKFTSVSLSYNKKIVLKNLDFEIKSGEFVFLIGKSGSGKSTFLKAYTGQLAPVCGTISNELGEDIYMLSGKKMSQFRRKCGIVFQDYKLIDTKTVYENVAFSMEVSGFSDTKILQRVPEVLSQVGLLLKRDRFPYELSGGEMRRVSIARAIVHNPDIIIADEPTGDLDPESRDQIMEIFSELHKKKKTIIFTTHDKTIVNREKKRVLVFRNGELVSDKNPGTYLM